MLIDTSVVRSNCDQKQKEENVWQCWIYRILHGVEVDVENMDITRWREDMDFIFLVVKTIFYE